MKHIRSWIWIDFRFIDSSTISYVNSCIRIQPWFHNILHNTELMNEFMIWIYDFKIMIMTSGHEFILWVHEYEFWHIISSYYDRVAQAAEFKFESKFEPLQVIWQSLPKAIWEDNRRFWLQNLRMAKLLGTRSGTAWAGRTGEHKHRAFAGRRRAVAAGRDRLAAAAARLKKTCYHSCDTDLVWESKRFFFFTWFDDDVNWIFFDGLARSF